MQLFSRAKKSTRRAVLRARRMHKRNARFGVVTLILFGLITSGANTAMALGATATQTVNDLSSTSASRNEVLNLKVQTPVADPGSTTQSITQWIDPLRYQIRSAADIIAPAGWVLTYSYDGSTFVATAPTTAAQWATVQGVKATGALVSEGTENGKQIASGEANATSSPDGIFQGSSSYGDGFDVIFDDSGHVFNVYHGGNGIDCHFRTGELCPGTWPKLFNNPATNTQVYFTNLKSTGWFDSQDKELWINTVNSTQLGFLCLDLSDLSATSIYCGYDADPANDYTEAFIPVRTQAANCYFTSTGILNRYECEAGLVAVAGKLFTWDTNNGDLLCVDVRAAGGIGAVCDTTGVSVAGVIDMGVNIPHAYSSVASVGAVAALNTNAELVNNGNLVYALSGYNFISCLDASTMSWCPGFAADGSKQLSTTTALSTFGINIPDASGTIVATCAAAGATVECFNPDGTTATTNYPANFAAAFKATWGSASTLLRDSPVTGGSKIYWTNSSYLYCWDMATDTQCPNFWQISKKKVYSVVIDPTGPSCVWSNGDDGLIAAWNTSTGTNGCATNVTVFAPSSFIPRMGCSSTGAIQGWRYFQLTAPAISAYTSATLKIVGSDGQPIAGWDNIALNSGTRTVDLSTLTMAQTGQAPRFLVTMNGQTDPIATAKISVLGEAPELCTTPKTVLCPVNPLGPFDAATLLPAETVAIRSDASYSDGVTTTSMTPGSADLTLPAQDAAVCSAILTGTAVVKGSTTPIDGAVVRLLDADGNAVLDANGNPVTTTTATDGTYSFGNLNFGKYTVSFDSTATMAASTGTTVSGATGTVMSTTSAVTYDGVKATAVVLASGVNGVVNATYVTPAPMAIPDTKGGLVGTAVSMTVVTNDLIPLGSTQTLDSSTVRLCGTFDTAPNCTKTSVSVSGIAGSIYQGTYTVVNGVVTYTPSAGSTFVGTVPGVTYSVTVAGTTTKLSSTATPVYVSATADATAGVMDAVQTKNVLTNDTGIKYVASTIRLCDPTTTPAQTSPNCSIAPGTTLTVPNVGTYVVDAAGLVTFTPVSGYVGTAPALGYQVSDASGLTVGSTYTVAVIGARPDVTSGPQGVAQNSNLYTNDTLSGAQNFKLCDPTTNPAQTAPNCNATAVTVAGVGSYTLNANGAVTFTPEPSFVGTAPALGYQTTDTSGRTVSSTYTPSVYAAPTAVADISSGPMNTAQTKNLLTNDNAVSSSVLLGSTLKLCDPTTTPAQTPNTCSATTVTVANVGTYSVDANGVVTFTPVTGYTGTPTALKYQAADAAGQIANSTYTPTIYGGPTATPDTTSGPLNSSQSFAVVSTDTAGAGTALVPSSLKLCDPAALTVANRTAPDCDATSVVVSGVGTYAININGGITFTPVTGYTGTPTPLSYQIADDKGQVASSTYTPTIYGAPTADPETTIDKMNVAQTINIFTGDVAGAGTTLTAGSIKLCDPNTSPAQAAPNCSVAPGTTITVANVGDYVVDTAGVMTFTPVTGYTGTPTPLIYQVTDNKNQVASSTYTPTVYGAPTADLETTSGRINMPQTINIFDGDVAGLGTTLLASSIRLCDPTTTPAQTPNNCTVVAGSTITVPNVGTYVVDAAGVVTFTPANNYTGTPAPLSYMVTDDKGQVATSTYTPTVYGVPTAFPNTTSGPIDVNQLINVLTAGAAGSIDTAGYGTTLDVSTIKLCDPNTSPAQSAPNCTVGVGTPIVVAGEGTYTLAADGTVTFDPLPAFVGSATPLKYQVADNLGQVANSTYTPTVLGVSVARVDATSGPMNTAQSIQLLGNDSPAFGATLVATSVKLCNPAANEVAPNCTVGSAQTAGIFISGVGTYTVDNTGKVTFTPVTGYTGTPTPLAYQVTDSANPAATVTSTYTPTIIPAPTANPNTDIGPMNAAQSENVVSNDAAATGTTLDPASVKLCDPNATVVLERTFPNCAATSLTVTGQGTYTVSNTGVITFTPDTGYTGTPTPVTYQVSDMLGQDATSTYAPVVYGIPTAVLNTTINSLDVNQSVNIFTNDTAGYGTTLDVSTLKLCDPALNQSAPDCTVGVGSPITVANVGTYTLAADGTITFDPLPTYTGTPTALKYQVADNKGQVANSTYTPTVYGVPTADAETTSGAMNTPQTINLLDGDAAGAGTTLVTSSLRLCDPTTTPAQTPNNCLVAAGTTITVPNVGTYSVDAAGLITFTPTATYTGTPPALKYQIADNYGQVANSTYTPTIIPAPTANPNTDIGPMNAAQSENVVTNDAAGTGGTLDPASVKLCDPNATVVLERTFPNCAATSLTVTGQGTYTVSNTGVITFTPDTGYTGTPTPVTYQVSDMLGQDATSTYSPDIYGLPTANPDTTINSLDVNQVFNIFTNDTAGVGTVLQVSTLKLCDPAAGQVAPNCTMGVGTPIVVAGVGTYTLAANGVITFDPLPTYTGTPTALKYQVADDKGQVANSTYTPTVYGVPTADPETTSGAMNTPQTINIFTGDAAGAGTTLLVSTIKLCDPTTNPAQVAPNCTVLPGATITVPNVGTYSVDAAGLMTFTPSATYSGTPAPLWYQVTDNKGQTASATYTPTVIPAPTAQPEAQTTAWNVAQSYTPLSNDSAATGTTLDVTSVKLCQVDNPATAGTNETQTPPTCTATTVVVPNQGTYVLNTSTNQVVFTPLASFTGIATPLNYIVKDALGQVATTTITPTITPPLAPAATPDVESVLPSHTVAFPSILTPTATSVALGSGTQLQPTVCFVVGNTCVTSTTTADGSWTINPATGVASFTANANVQEGTLASVTYKITDVTGQTATSTLTPIVPPPPVASPDYSAGEMNKSQLLSLLGNDRPGVGAADLVPSTVAFVCPIAGATCTATSVTIPNEGTYTIQPNGTVKFVPVTDFVGTGSQVPYRVTDDSGQTATSFLQAKVYPPPFPTAITDTGSAAYNQTVTFSPWLNDAPGNLPAGATEPAPNLVISSIRLCAVGEAVPNCTATTVTTDDGTYVLNPATGVVVFTPVDGFIGTATSPVTYQVSNDWTGFTGPGASTAMLIPTIGPPGAPVAAPDERETLPMVPITLDPVSNDPGGAFPLDPTTLRLCDITELAPACVSTTVTTKLGTFVVDTTTGHVTFTPTEAFNPTTTAFVPYVIADTRGTFTQAHITITDPPVPLIAAADLVHTGVTGLNGQISVGLFAVIAGFGLFYYSSKRKAKASSNA